MKNALALVALASCITAACRAATPPPVPENLLACGKLQDPGERVRCYDTQIAAMKAAAAAAPTAAASAPATSNSAPVIATSAPAVTTSVLAVPTSVPGAAVSRAPRSAPTSASAAPSQSSEAQFGQELLPPTARPAVAQKEIALQSSIKALTEVAAKTYVISLSNGQVWRQEEPSQIALFFRVGNDVRIERGALGSYHMSTAAMGSKNWVRVTRIQ
jgi:hypothetical protein